MIALLDACTLYPPALRDLFMWLATARAYQPRWSERIHNEWIRSVLANRSDVSPEQLERTRELMDKVDPECLVTGYERHISSLALPDADDRHVLAAAIEAQAPIIVTFNLSDFPASVLASLGIVAMHPDAFLCQLMEEEAESTVVGVRRHRASLRRPPKTGEEYLATLQASGLTRFVALLTTQEEEI